MLNEEKKIKCVALHSEGKHIGEIADSLNVYRDTARKWLRMVGIEPRPSIRKVQDGDVSNGRFTYLNKRKAKLKPSVVDLHNLGMSAIDISKRIDVSDNTVRKWLRDFGLIPHAHKKNVKKIVRNGRFAHLK